MKTTAVRIGCTGTLDGTEVHRLQLEGLFGPCQKGHKHKGVDGFGNDCKFKNRMCHTSSY